MPLLSIFAAGLGLALIAELRRCRRIEQAALANERRYRFLAEHSFDMIVRFDPRTQQRTYISPAVRRMYGYRWSAARERGLTAAAATVRGLLRLLPPTLRYVPQARRAARARAGHTR